MLNSSPELLVHVNYGIHLRPNWQQHNSKSTVSEGPVTWDLIVFICDDLKSSVFNSTCSLYLAHKAVDVLYVWKLFYTESLMRRHLCE